ncbi:MAG: acyclic terpene utilization AtuA family protein, partial [Caldimonas sp.]
RGIKVISNAGGINPAACADALRALAAEQGIRLRIAVVEGDDVMALLSQPTHGRLLSANAYLGAVPIARALDAGADVVITGRCVDSAVTLGALMHEFGWTDADFDRLAAGSLAGHLIECGCQATGGLFTDWQDVPDWAGIGYPIAECRRDGSFVVTKPPGTGGLVVPAAVSEQLLYEIGDPAAYLLPDVICDFRDVTIEPDGPARVRVAGARGSPPTDRYKVSATSMDGYRAAGTLVVVGIDAVRKAQRTGEAILERTRTLLRDAGLADYRASRIEVVGGESLYGPHGRVPDAREVMMRVVVDHASRPALELFAREIAPAGTSWSPGTTGASGGRPSVSPLITPSSFLIDKREVTVHVVLDGVRHRIEPALHAGSVPSTPPRIPPPFIEPDGPTVDVPLVRLAWARSGDKGDLSNIGLVARRREWLPLLWSRITPEVVHAYFAHLVDGPVERFYLPGIAAINLLLHGALDGGGTASHRIDPLGKGMGQMLLDLQVSVPAEVAAQFR